MKTFSHFPYTYAVDELRANASNNPVRIVIRRRLRAFAAVLAQERYEWGLKWKWLILPYIIFFMLIRPHHNEIMGHAVECAVAEQWYGEDLDAYEASEAEALYWGYGGVFRKHTIQGIAALLKARREDARNWVNRHRDYINRAYTWGQMLEKNYP